MLAAENFFFWYFAIICAPLALIGIIGFPVLVVLYSYTIGQALLGLFY